MRAIDMNERFDIAPTGRASRPTAALPGWRFCIAIAAWGVLLGVMWKTLLEHAYLPAATHSVSDEWPRETRLGAPREHPCIVLFAHPFCPCTHSSLGELRDLIDRLPPATQVEIVFVTPGLEPSRVMQSANVSFACDLRRANVMFDATGEESRRFGATASGEVLLFDGKGRRLFQGGITPARGHRGEARGQELIERLARGQSAPPGERAAPVFGCRLPQ
jgi:hypothetical protein